MVFRLNRNNKKISKLSPSVISGMIFFVLFFSVTISAKTLEEYKKNLKTLKNSFAALTIDDGFESAENVFEKAAALLPAEETIKVDGVDVEVDNIWLKTEIAKFKAKSKDAEKLQIVTAIYERLEAIELKIDELQKATESNAGKDEQKRKLAEILNREEYQKPGEEEKSFFQRFLTWINNWLNQNAPKTQTNLPPSNFGSVARVFQIVLYVIVIGAIIFLFYKFAPFLLKKFREREKKDKNERIILGEKISSGETSSNLFSEAEKLALEGHLRDAIRKGYVAFLFELSERKLIGLAKHKTNRDYLKAIRKKQDLYKNMDGLTLNYERHWYGFEDADEDDWREFRKDYEEALRKN